MHHLLIVDDDPDIRGMLGTQLCKAGFEVRTAQNGQEMRWQLGRAPADLIILDVSLPGEDGFSLCRYARSQLTTPVIILSARRDPVDCVVGLELGADDYVTKPFDPNELVARVRTILRRVGRPRNETLCASEASIARFSGWTLDFVQRHLTDPDDRLVVLSGMEFRILSELARHPGAIVSRDQLAFTTTGRALDGLQRSIDVHMSRLRRKLRDDSPDSPLVKTVRGQGYVLVAEVTLE
jgi:two-component system, OmpR family, response regulator